ncbi:sugar phosphate isomerase/epimerase [Candidatus Poribacteria bacterium]|nr:sugar phosphate isomerase/epimerase [Candidatus Poribacteria bacterium]
MRLGAPVFQPYDSPERWAEVVRSYGYRAAYAPVGYDAPADGIRAYAEAASAADLVIAEVGAWSNPLSPDEATRKKALDHCKKSLQLAEDLGARCCVNIAGSRGTKWDGPCPEDLTETTFEMIVATVREIIDAVEPRRTYYALEMMPWMYPDSPDSALRLIHAIDRRQYGVHFDPTNIIGSPQRFFGTGAVIRECVQKLGPHIRSCHLKDAKMGEGFLVHLDETRPGTGSLDYGTLLRELNRLDPDLPAMLEHLPNEEEYRLAADYVRSVANREHIAL